MSKSSPKDRYQGFLSYSHAADDTLAPQLQSALHTFAKPWYRLRAIRIFRDKTSLSATPSLWPSIQAALQNSEFLLLMASPDAAKSHWVIKELGTFLGVSGPARVLIVLTEGELTWDDRAGDFDWRHTNAFPRLPRPIFTAEPLWVDLRALRSAEDVSMRNPDFRDGVARLSATLRGIPADQLIGEDIRQHRKAMGLLWSGLVLFAVLALGLALAGAYSYRKGIEAQAAAARTRAEFMVSSATTLENEDPLTAAMVLSELGSNYQSDRGLALLRRVANELPLTVLPGSSPKLSRDGSRLLTLPKDATVLLWSVDALEKPVVLKGHGSKAVDAAIDDHGYHVAIGSDDGTVTIWDVNDHREVTVLNGYGPTYEESIAFDGEGERVAFLGPDTSARIVTISHARTVVLNGHSKELVSIAFSVDGQRVVTTSLDHTTRVWNVDGSSSGVFRSDRSYPIHAEFSGDGRYILTRDDNGTVRSWRIGLPGSSVVFNPLDYTPSSVAFHPNGRSLVAGTKEGVVLVWSINAPQSPSVLRGHTGRVDRAAFMPDGSVVSASYDGTVRVWNLVPEPPPIYGEFQHTEVIKVHHGIVFSVLFDTKYQRLFTSDQTERTQVWNPYGEEGEAIVLKGHEDQIFKIDFSPDGKHVVTASADRTARVWSTTGAGEPLILRGHSGAVSSASFSPDSKHIVTVSAKDGTARIWSADARADPVVLRGESGPVTSAAFSSDGSRVLTVSGRARIWTLDGHPGSGFLGDAAKPAKRAEFSPDGTRILMVSKSSAFVWNADGHGVPVELKTEGGGPLAEARFSPDGKWVLGCSGRSATIWQADGGGHPVVLDFDSGVNDARFSPDGRRVLVVGVFGGYIWRADGQGEPLFLTQPNEGEGDVEHGVFSADGKLVAASNLLKYVAMSWKTDGPSLPLVLSGQKGWVNDVAISPDGQLVGTALSDGTARLWSIEWQDLMKYVDARVTHTRVCLDAAQRIQYLGEEAVQAQSHFQACESRFARF